MTLQLHDTRTRRTRPFTPLVPGRVGVYVCGPTVQSAPHVGHVRSAVSFDVLRRWLLASGYAVTWVRNVTDIDDKIIVNAVTEGATVWELAERHTRAFNAAYDALGCLPPTVEPRATGHIPEIVAMMHTLVERGTAYAAAGSVWFSVAAFPGYGQLSGVRPDAVLPSAEADDGKRDPRDFALWKAARPGEPSWESPWGPGRPGWHLECSAMSLKYLGQPFDIHGAGLDLVFPHNENELAQSVCAGPEGETLMAATWLHNGLVTTGGEKMSKSLGNSLLVSDVLSGVRPQVLRYHFAAAHYRSAIEYTPDGLLESGEAYARLERFVRHALELLGGIGEAEVLALTSPAAPEADAAWAAFAAAMDDDLAVSRALAAVFGAVTRGNAVLSAARRNELAAWYDVVQRMLLVLGLDPVSQWPDADAGLRPVLARLVDAEVARRAEAKGRRDFAVADEVRARLKDAGIALEDTPDGTRWQLS